jgi:putative DNA methylase
MNEKPRLIERAFPLKQTSLSSVHEKNVRHGHISTLHIWPARRPLAACRAALLATLLPDPGTNDERRKLCERIGGTVVEKIERKKMPNGHIVERIKEETEGGVLRWIGIEPKSGGRKKIEQHRKKVAFRESELAWFRDEIKKAYGGRAPRVLDPFAGGGAIPLEAMRLGCEATAVDINPVAWFILKCTLEYPQKLAGKTHPLPDFILEDEDFMEAFYKAHPHLVGRTKKTKRQKSEPQRILWEKKDSGRIPKADLAWHVRAWGRWVLNQARKELAPFYPTYADFEPIDFKKPNPYEKQPMRLVTLKDDGTPDIDALNDESSDKYLKDKGNPRWVPKPTVAYLWARTVKCKNCRGTVPLLKTRWLCKKDRKRVLLTMDPKTDKTGVAFDIENDVPVLGGNPAQKREHDKRIGAGTMSRAGVKCPCCEAIMTMEDIRIAGMAGRLGVIATAVVTESQSSKAYRLPTSHEIECARSNKDEVERIFSGIPLGPINEAFSPASTRSISCQLYGITNYGDFFTSRQHMAIGVFIYAVNSARQKLLARSIPKDFQNAINSYLCLSLDRVVDYSNAMCSWHIGREIIRNLFGRFSISLIWDFCELPVINKSTGGFMGAIEWIALSIEHLLKAVNTTPPSKVRHDSSTNLTENYDKGYDLIITDPPYYEAISYADLSELFYVVLRRVVQRTPFTNALMDKKNEVVQHIRSDKNRQAEKEKYESMMAKAFRQAFNLLTSDGRFVIVFAHKQPDAWETLVSAMIKSGFVVDGSWPIQTEMANRTRGLSAAALGSSVWLVCKKRLITARPGWDNKVLEEMRANITEGLRDYWDAGIRGPDFIWAATGPALEAYSKHPIVKKANTPKEVMSVGEFLSHVRRMVVDFIVGQVLTGDKEGLDMAAADRMDAPTAYYLLHRHDFGLEDAPAGACILYATACGLSDRDLESAWDLVSHKGSTTQKQDGDEDPDPAAESDQVENGDSGSKIRIKTWAQRKRRAMGFEAPSGRPIPLIDRVHRLMHLWRAGDVHKIDEYLDDNGLRRQELFKRLVQSLIELSNGGSDERSILESLSNHIQTKGAVFDAQKNWTVGDHDITK